MILLLMAALAAGTPAPADVPAKAGTEAAKSMAKISSDSTYYDRKEGFAYFNGHVFVNDEQYKLHADRAYVYMSASNDLQRIVALGNVAITNGTKRAYGVKASYHRQPGLIILSSGEGPVAEVWDETPGGRQVVRGKKIKFWTNSEQVEVVEAELSAPSAGGAGNLKGLIGGR